MRLGSIDMGGRKHKMDSNKEVYQLFCKYCMAKFEATTMSEVIAKIDSHELECRYKKDHIKL